jgi:hypothetical protein
MGSVYRIMVRSPGEEGPRSRWENKNREIWLRTCSRFVCLRTGSSGGPLWTRKWTWGLHKMLRTSRVVERWWYEGRWHMEWTVTMSVFDILIINILCIYCYLALLCAVERKLSHRICPSLTSIVLPRFSDVCQLEGLYEFRCVFI